MLNNFKKPQYILLSLVILTLIIRTINYSFPVFTSDEARIAYRSFTLSQFGTDELGRNFPILFNSLTDYQLPALSYLSSLGVLIFGKTEFGVRIPFTLLWIALVVLIYKVASIISPRKDFWYISSVVLIFSPALIFLSRVPNEALILTFSTFLLFYLFIQPRFNLLLTLFAIIFSLTISKFTWFIIPPFVIFTLFVYRNDLPRKIKLFLSFFSLILVITIIGLYLQVPQAERSLRENNFSLFSNDSIINGINKLRGQGIESGWPSFIEVVLFNKSSFVDIGLLHWLSSLQPAIYFGQFDQVGQFGFSQAGALSKVFIIPFILGIIYIVQSGNRKERLLLFYILILSFPAAFIYPGFDQSLVVLTLPFIALIIAMGFMKINNKILFSGIFFMVVLELGITLLFLSPEYKKTHNLRPVWVEKITKDIYYSSLIDPIGISDDLSSDIIAFTQWYQPLNDRPVNLGIDFPYKYRLSQLSNINTIGSDQELFTCKYPIYKRVFVSNRDKEKIGKKDMKIVKTYENTQKNKVGFLLEGDMCI